MSSWNNPHGSGPHRACANSLKTIAKNLPQFINKFQASVWFELQSEVSEKVDQVPVLHAQDMQCTSYLTKSSKFPNIASTNMSDTIFLRKKTSPN